MPDAGSRSRSAQETDFVFEVGEFERDDLRVVGFSGSEGLSELFEFKIQFSFSLTDVDFAGVIGKPCCLEISGAGGERYVHGIVRRFERTGHGSNLTYWTAEVVPVFWLLTRRIRSRIFQSQTCSDMTAPGIIKKVFETAGIPEAAYRLALAGTYPTREYVVQYRESEWDFVSRLMEEEGIYYFFEHSAEGHKLVLADGGSAQVASPLSPECVYRDPTGLVSEGEFIHSLQDAGEIQIGVSRLKDFDFTHPPLVLKGEKTGVEFTALEFSDYPGLFLTKEEGTRLATVRFEEQQCRKRVLGMSATVRGLAPGEKFTLAEHPAAALNREYLVTRLVHEARQPQSLEAEAGSGEGARHTVTARLIPSDVTFRAPRITPRPAVRGSQTAMVVGPAGEEIYTDKYGRVKIQFHWDLEGAYDENSSCWVRVSQGMAGGQYGMMFLPRVGQEVVVDFLEGDPDRPLVTGRVFNSDQMPPYTLPEHKTRSVIKTNSSIGGGGTNELMFEDLKDNEKILLYAQKDLHVRIKHDRVENVENDRYLTVKQHKFELVEQKSHREVKLDANEKIGGKLSQDIVGDWGVRVGGNHSEEATGRLFLKSDDEVVIEAAKGLTLKVGGNFVKIDSSGIAIAGSMTKINSGGMAGNGVSVALGEVEAPVEADQADPGRDTRYQAQDLVDAALELADQIDPPDSEPEERITSWVEIEMVDETGQPWKNEYYEVTRADGVVISGHLDDRGLAHVLLPTNETPNVRFPRLDTEAWVRKS